MRHALDGAHLGQDLLAHLAVAARRRADELAALVGQIERQPVELVLQGILLLRAGGELFHAVGPVAQALGGLGLVQRPEARQVPVGHELLERLPADAPRGAVRQAEAGLLLQAQQLVKEQVVFAVRNGGVVQHVVAVGVPVELVHHPGVLVEEPGDALVLQPQRQSPNILLDNVRA